MPPATRSSLLHPPPPPATPEADPTEFPCHHASPCTRASPPRPLDATHYANALIRAPNSVTAAYIESNLRLSAHDLIFASASFRQLLIALPDAVSRLLGASPVTTGVHASYGWVILTDDANVTLPILHACAGALARLNVCTPVSEAHLAAFTPTHASHRATDGWTTIPTSHVDLTNGFIDLKTKRGRQFLCYLGSFLMLLWRSDSERFVLAVHGYSGHGKTHTVMGKDGLLDAMLHTPTALGGLKLTVRETLHEDVVVGEFLLHAGGGDAIPGTVEQIKVVLRTAGTPANAQSSRRHTLVTVGSDGEPGVVYGMVVDVAGEETSRNRALLPQQTVQTSNVICADNAAFRKLLRECGLGVVSPVTKRASKLNMRVVDFGGRMVVMMVADPADLEVLKKAVTI